MKKFSRPEEKYKYAIIKNMNSQHRNSGITIPYGSWGFELNIGDVIQLEKNDNDNVDNFQIQSGDDYVVTAYSKNSGQYSISPSMYRLVRLWKAKIEPIVDTTATIKRVDIEELPTVEKWQLEGNEPVEITGSKIPTKKDVIELLKVEKIRYKLKEINTELSRILKDEVESYESLHDNFKQKPTSLNSKKAIKVLEDSVKIIDHMVIG